MLVASGAAIKLVPTQYEASGELLLILPATATGVKTPTNPYLNLQSGLTIAGSLIAGSVATKDTQRDMSQHGFRSEYSVALNPGTGPLLVISADDVDPHEAVRTRDEVIRRLKSQLAQIQSDAQVPERQIITTREFSVTQTAEALPGSKIRALAVIVAGGSVGTLVLCFAFDRKKRKRLHRRIQRRRLRHSASSSRITDTDSPLSIKTRNGSAVSPADDVTVPAEPQQPTHTSAHSN